MIEIDEYMSSPVITIEGNKTVAELAKLMSQHSVGSIVVIEGEKPLGIVTERDIVNKVISQDKQCESVLVSDIMTTSIQMVPKEATLMEIAAKMKEHTMRRLVVVEGEKVVGIITSRDLIGLLV